MDNHQGTHFWFMSIIAPTPGGFESYRRSGHFTPKPGSTRFDAFNLLVEVVKERSPELRRDDIVVISFDVQPNKL